MENPLTNSSRSIFSEACLAQIRKIATAPSNAPTGCISSRPPAPLGAGGVPLVLVVDTADCVLVANVVLLLLDEEPPVVFVAVSTDDCDCVAVVDESVIVDIALVGEILVEGLVLMLVDAVADIVPLWVLVSASPSCVDVVDPVVAIGALPDEERVVVPVLATD